MVTTPVSASVSASLSWGQIVKNTAVANNGTLVVNTPGIISPENYDFANAQVTQDGYVLQPSAQFTLAWAGDFSSVTVTNKTGAPWPVNSTVPTSVLMQLQAPDHGNAAIANLTARVTALEAKTTTVVPVVTPQNVNIPRRDRPQTPSWRQWRVRERRLRGRSLVRRSTTRRPRATGRSAPRASSRRLRLPSPRTSQKALSSPSC